MRNNFALTPQSSTYKKKAYVGGLLLRGFIGAAMVAALAGAMSGTAAAAPDGETEANVAVSSALELTGLTPNFTLTGLPGATVTGTGAVTFTVMTNNTAGYAVTVQSETATMTPGDAVANPDSIPVGALGVRETGGTTFAPLSTSTVTVHTQGTRSAEGGDDLSNDFQVVIPFVNEDTYSATLDYIATTL